MDYAVSTEAILKGVRSDWRRHEVCSDSNCRETLKTELFRRLCASKIGVEVVTGGDLQTRARPQEVHRRCLERYCAVRSGAGVEKAGRR